MSVQTLNKSKVNRNYISEAEWDTRIKLAAAYRIAALEGWTYLGASHISARVPDEEGAFLLNLTRFLTTIRFAFAFAFAFG